VSEAGERVLLLVGSPKGLGRSNSSRLGGLVLERLERRGWTSESIHLHAAVRSEESRAELMGAIDRASVVVFASPLYVDTLPAPAIRALELIAEHRRSDDSARIPRFVSIVNCGFVEPSQNDTCQQLLARFAQSARFEWASGVSTGGGGTITKRIREAFDILVEALDIEILVPDEVERLTRRPLLPRWLYIVVGNAMWRRMAAKNGAKERLRDRPYERSAR